MRSACIRTFVSMLAQHHHAGRVEGLKIPSGDPEMLRYHQPRGRLRAIFDSPSKNLGVLLSSYIQTQTPSFW